MTDFKIGDREYDFPTKFRFGDTTLIEELTGLTFVEFSERLDDLNQRVDEAKANGETAKGDMLVMVGLMGVGIWQANPRWKRERVLAFVEQVDMEAFETIAADDVPPTTGTGDPENHSPASSVASTTSPVISPVAEPV